MSEAGWTVWSDGSCIGNPGPGGWAAIVLQDGEEIAVLSGPEDRSTNQRMEMRAAVEGLARVPPGSRVTLMTDSMFVINGMTKWVAGWKRKGWRKADGGPVANLELWQRLDRLASERRVTWTHVRGHAGVAMNERCDRLANAQARSACPPAQKGYLP